VARPGTLWCPGWAWSWYVLLELGLSWEDISDLKESETIL
jgi:hypothetical protein